MGSIFHGNHEAHGKTHQVKRRVALIGLGRIGWLLENDRLRYHPCTHAGALLSFPGRANLVAVCDNDPARLKDFLEWWPHPVEAFSDFAELFSAMKKGRLHVDMAVLATPQEVHCHQAIRLLQLNLLDLLIEKPPGENGTQVARLRKEWQQSSTRLWINFERRFHTGYGKVDQIIQSRKFGVVRSVRGRVNSGASPGVNSGPLLHDGVHWLDLLFWFFDIPLRMSGTILRDGSRKERSSHLMLHYSDFVATLETCIGQFFEFEMEIDFDAGRIHCGNSGFYLWKSTRSSRYSGFRELKQSSFKIQDPGNRKDNPWRRMYRTILDSTIRPQNYNPGNTEKGLQTVEFIHRAYRKF